MNSQRIRVPAGFAFAIVYAIFCRPTPPAFAVGVGLAGLGLAVRLWAAGHLRKWKGLAVSGPYRFTRNPLYFGSFVMGLGFTVASARWLLVSLFALLFILIYVPVMRREEEELRQGYGDDFEAYRSRVPLFFPRPPAGKTPQETDGGNFRWRQVILNREHHAVAGFAAITALVWLKMLWQ